MKSIGFKLKKIAAAVGACMALGIGGTTAAFADSAPQLEGSWSYTVTIPGPFVFKGVETYAAGGGHGTRRWKITSGRTFLLTYVNLTYAKGSPTGYLESAR